MSQPDDLITTVASYINSPDVKPVLTTAYQIADNAHSGYQRVSGEAFISHPLAVASTLAEWRAPLRIIAVSLVHDIFNLDYSHGYVWENIDANLGAEISRTLETALDLNSVLKELENELDAGIDVINPQRHIDSFLQRDRDVIVLKIADRMHNLQTISFLTRIFQERAARIGFSLLAPLTDRLGMGATKRQLEDYCFEVFNATPYTALQRLSNDRVFHQKVQAVARELQSLLRHDTNACQVRWIANSLYSLYYHQVEQNSKKGKAIIASPLPLQILDAGSFVIETAEDNCYPCLGMLHKAFAPVRGQIYDFIGQPRENGYRSLHTQVKHPLYGPLQVIIRTHTMDLVAERGITASWWGVSEELLPSLPKEVRMLEEKIQVFTADGKIVELPEGATVLDCAYSIHTDLGHRCAGALVNGKHEERFTSLQTGDRIEIISGTTESGPGLSWLSHVRTPDAAQQIRQWLAQHQRNEMVARGRQLLDKDLISQKLNPNDDSIRELLLVVANKEGLESAENLLVSIGVGRHKPFRIVDQLKSRRSRPIDPPNYGELGFGVYVLSPNEVSLPVTFAHCCNPLPPDDIVGQRRNDNMLAIHKRTCAQAKKLENSIAVRWNTTPAEPKYVVVVEALNRPGLTSDLGAIMALSGIDIPDFNAHKRADGVMADATIHLNRTTSTQRSRIQKELENIPYITKVEIIPSAFFATTLPQADLMLSSQPNPFGPTVAHGLRFYGRKTEYQRISALLHNPYQNTTILVWGQRRIGKTSLMVHLQEQLQKEKDCMSIYMDMQGLTESSTAQFLHQLVSRIATAFKGKVADSEQEISVPALNKMRKDPLSYFDAFMTQLQKTAQNYLLVIILDECQCLCSLREELASREAIFNRLRSHSQHGHGIRFVLSGGGQKSLLINQCHMTSLFNIAHDEKLGCLESQDAYDLVKNGITRIGKITQPAIKLLLELTAGHPFYLQLLCYKLYEQLEEQKAMITADIVSQFVHKWLDEANSDRFQHLWEGQPREGAKSNKIILSAIAELTDHHAEMNFKLLADAIGPLLPESKLIQSLNDLVDLGILEQDHTRYTIKVGLFARWLRLHWPLELALKEAQE